MVKLSIPWPPVCTLCGQSILSLDTGVVVMSDDLTLPEIDRAKYAQHRFCAVEEPPYSIDLRDFAALVHKAVRRDVAG